MFPEQLLINRGSAELINDDRRTRQTGQQAVEQRRLAAAQKAGQDQDGDALDGFRHRFNKN